MELQVKNIRKSFGDKEVLHGINFTVTSGRAMGFLGRNGAGKSTTIRCLMDVFRQDGGQFLLGGVPFRPEKHHIGYLPEERGMYAKNVVLDQLVYFARLRGAQRAEAERSASHWINYFELDEYKKKPLEQLSKGNQQKIQIAQAFLNDPDILILDEPFSGLDPVNAQVFKDAIRDFVARGKLVIFSSHQMGYVEEICDDITLIHQGDILLSGNLKQIKRALGKNKLRLSVEGADAKEVTQALQTQFPAAAITQQNGMLVMDTGDALTQKDLLPFIAQKDWTLAGFGVYEPSLNDIFVEKVSEKE